MTDPIDVDADDLAEDLGVPGLDALRDAAPPEPARVHRRVARRRWRRRAVAGGAVLAAVGLAVVLQPGVQPGGVRDRGVEGAPLVGLHAVAEGPAGVRALAAGAVVAADERVVFFVTSSADGWARLTEDGAPVYPTTGTWRVSAGESAPTLPRGDVPLAWRPDRAVSAARYAVEVCPEPDAAAARCGRAALRLRWAP